MLLQSQRPVIRHSCYPVEPWRLHDATLDLDLLAEPESILALSNGHIGLVETWTKVTHTASSHEQVARSCLRRAHRRSCGPDRGVPAP